MPVRAEILEDGACELLTVVGGQTRFIRYNDIGKALAKAKEILRKELLVAKAEMKYGLIESKRVPSNPRVKEG